MNIFEENDGFSNWSGSLNHLNLFENTYYNTAGKNKQYLGNYMFLEFCDVNFEIVF